MTNEERPDFERYQYGALAARLASSEESVRFAPGALETLAGGKGLGLGEDAQGFISGTFASERGIQIAIGNYAGKFEKNRGEYKPAELANWYMPVIADLNKKTQDKILTVLNEYDEPLKAIEKTVERAGWISKAPEGERSEAEIAEAKNLVKHYENLFKVMGLLDSFMFELLRGDAVSATRKRELEVLLESL